MLRWLAASDWQDIPELTEEKKKTGGIAICQNPDGDKDGSGRPCAANVFRGCPEVHRLVRMRSLWQTSVRLLLDFRLTKMSLGCDFFNS